MNIEHKVSGRPQFHSRFDSSQMDEISDTFITYNVSVISDMYREKQNMIKAATKAMKGHLKAFKKNPGIHFL